MSYGKRLDTLFSLLKPAEVFADVGCDHGYAGEYMLKNGLCKKAILSDISPLSLQKAEKLLRSYMSSGQAELLCCAGFSRRHALADEVLIAGMGSEEIVGILSNKTFGFLPKRFLFQPMHGAPILRKFVLENGGIIERDFMFSDGRKFYEVIAGRKKKDGEAPQTYTEAETEFGRENLLSPSDCFKKRIERLLKETETYLQSSSLSDESKRALTERREKLRGVKNGEIK